MTTSEAFFMLYGDLPRQAPGSDTTTHHLLALAGQPTGKALDIGCGQGRASLLLAQSGIEVTAVDVNQSFLNALQTNAAKQGLGDKITTRNESMDALSFPDDSFDVIWSEGAAYILGWRNALVSWRRLIKSDGLLVATECCWLTDASSKEPEEFWAENYSSMVTANEAAQIAIDSEYEVIDRYVLPKSSWWDEYYTPLREKCDMLQTSPDKILRAAIASARREIMVYEKYSDEYGYVGFVLRKR
ncbi:MAG: class I SAM-dependent methyltransferase [Sphaerimonospora mesophila]